MKIWLCLLAALLSPTVTFAQSLVFDGGSGFGKGMHIVFIANDHEYRSEQTCPALAKLMAKHYGFKCTVLFGLDEDGNIKPGAKDLPGLEVLKDADLVFFFTRFMNLADEQADLLVEYFERGGPSVGVRASTHCFNGQKGKWEKLNFNYTGDDYTGGLGQQVYGNTWHKERGQSHYGSNHQMGSRITPVSGSDHPILTGVKSIHAYSGAYKSQPPADATPLLEVQVLNTFGPSDDINKDRPIVNAGWARETFTAPSGKQQDGRVVYTSFGASEDLFSEDGRRFLVNACLWAGGWEDQITADLNVSLVGKYSPTPYNGGTLFSLGVKPQDLAGWDSEVMPLDADMHGVGDANGARRVGRVLQNRPELKAKLAAKYPELYGPDAKLPPAPPKKKRKK